MRYSTHCLSFWPMVLRNKQEKVIRRQFAWRTGFVWQIGGGGLKELDETILNIQKSHQTDKNWRRCGSIWWGRVAGRPEVWWGAARRAELWEPAWASGVPWAPKVSKAAIRAISQSLRAGPTSLLPLFFFMAGHHPPVELNVLNRQYSLYYLASLGKFSHERQ